jgi:nucleotide-binding universal stress UspA family protein
VEEAVQMYENILVTLDGSKLAECVLPHVETVYKGCEKPKVTFVRAVEPVQLPYGEGMTGITLDMLRQAEVDEKAEAKAYLEKIAAKMGKLGMPAQTKVLAGKAADVVVDYVNKGNFDLVILCTHGRSGISRWVWGSVADRVLHHVCVPVMMVRTPGCGLLMKEK